MRCGRLGPASSIVPTSVRTMCRRKLSAVIVKSRRSPSCCHAAACTSRDEDLVLRLGRRERTEVVLAAEKRGCRLRGRRRRRAAATRALGAPRAATRAPRRGRGSGTSASEPRSARGSRRARPRPRPRPRPPAVPRSAPRRRDPAAARPRPSTLATCPVACTPVSVRPATASPSQRGNTAASASRTTPSTVRRPG